MYTKQQQQTKTTKLYNQLQYFKLLVVVYQVLSRVSLTDQKKHTVGTVPRSNSKIEERCEISPLTQKYLNAHFPH